MALYKNKDLVTYSNSVAFDTRYAPGAKVENAGIYRCTVCDEEIVVARSRTLPPPDHHPHETGAKIQWQLLVVAQGKRGTA